MKKELQITDQSNILSQGTGETRPPEKHVQKPETAKEASAKKPMSLKKELLGLLCLILALALFCAAVTPILTPKRHDYGAVWGMYLKEPEDSIDAMFFGSSLAYCDVVPSVIYEEAGITSFVMAGPDQTFPVTYRYLREACKTQSPKTVFIEATGLVHAETSSFVKVNLTYMPWSQERLIPTFEEPLTEGGKTPEETKEMEQSARTGLLFPLYAYHDRWDELSLLDFKEGLLGYDTDPLAGYTFLKRIMPIEEMSARGVADDEDIYARNLEYAGKMVEFCKEQGIRLIFFLSPLTQQLSGKQRAKLFEDLAALGAEFADFNDNFDAFGFDLSTDFYDERHLNYRGAEKFSRYLAGRLPEWGVTPSGNEDKSLWQERADRFAALRKEAEESSSAS